MCAAAVEQAETAAAGQPGGKGAPVIGTSLRPLAPAGPALSSRERPRRRRRRRLRRPRPPQPEQLREHGKRVSERQTRERGCRRPHCAVEAQGRTGVVAADGNCEQLLNSERRLCAGVGGSARLIPVVGRFCCIDICRQVTRRAFSALLPSFLV